MTHNTYIVIAIDNDKIDGDDRFCQTKIVRAESYEAAKHEARLQIANDEACCLDNVDELWFISNVIHVIATNQTEFTNTMTLPRQS